MADPAQSFSTGFQVGAQNANAAISRNLSMAQMAEQKRQFDVVEDLRNQEFSLRKQQANTALDGLQTQNQIQKIALDQARTEQEFAPQYAQWAANLAKTPVTDLVNFKFPAPPTGGTLKQQTEALGLIQSILRSASSNVSALNSLKNRLEDEEQAQKLKDIGYHDVYNADGSINYVALSEAQSSANEEMAGSFIKQFGLDADVINAKNLFDRRGKITEFGETTLKEAQRNKTLEQQLKIADKQAEARQDAMDARTKAAYAKQLRDQAEKIELAVKSNPLYDKNAKSSDLARARKLREQADSISGMEYTPTDQTTPQQTTPQSAESWLGTMLKPGQKVEVLPTK